MATLIQAESISEAWLKSLEFTNAQQNGKAVHLLTSVADPSRPEDPQIRSAVDRILTPTTKRASVQSVDTIANTIFPISLYPDPGISWSSESSTDSSLVESAAEKLYSNYATIFSNLQKAHRENTKGTYFSRMISWPGKTMNGYNQLEKRLQHLRGKKADRVTAFNASDMALTEPGGDSSEINIYAVSDHRVRSFPCLVHIDIGVFAGKVNLLGVYRHQMLIQKGYGNLIGLARLQKFIAQQSGYGLGELAVQATFACAEQQFFTKRGVNELVATKLQGAFEI
ncbi:hypothetical protein V3C41_11385 [Paenarthrobacter nicotinovorans]|uniref:Uncharacterized protein n=1 Tax=Paenarthrobacter nicotinovorans TaxID=29320 RepID=A0ABV0GSV4_PAENI